MVERQSVTQRTAPPVLRRAKLPRPVRQLLGNVPAVIGLVVILVIVVMAIAAPALSPADPNTQNLRLRLQPPSAEHPFGTDAYGRDLLSRTLWGARVSLTVGLLSALLGIGLGMVVGLLAGFAGGRVEAVAMQITDMFLAFPSLLFALMLAAMLGGNLRNLIIAIGITTAPNVARLVRSSVLSTRDLEFVTAARALGARNRRLILQHVLPNIVSPIIVYGSLLTAGAILTEAGLSFLGVGVQPPTPSWGNMISQGRTHLVTAPWLSVIPGAFILVTVMALNLVGDAMRDILDPKTFRR